MLSDPDSIKKANGALDKYADAEEKLCDIIHSQTTSENDRLIITEIINYVAGCSQRLSLLLPPEPDP